jgi:hypothetical protein
MDNWPELRTLIITRRTDGTLAGRWDGAGWSWGCDMSPGHVVAILGELSRAMGDEGQRTVIRWEHEAEAVGITGDAADC